MTRPVTNAGPETLRAVLFDATGTLIELRESVGECYARVARNHGIDLPARQIEDAWRRIVPGRTPRCFPDAAANEVPRLERDWWHSVVCDLFLATRDAVVFGDFDAFFDELWGGYAKPGAWRLRGEVAPALETLRKRGLRLAIVSDFDYRLTEVLEGLGIASFFESIVLAGALGAMKPDPRLFQAALGALGVPARQAVYVGDDPEKDLEGARAVGLAPLDVRSLETFAELPDRLATLSLPSHPDRRERQEAK